MLGAIFGGGRGVRSIINGGGSDQVDDAGKKILNMDKQINPSTGLSFEDEMRRTAKQADAMRGQREKDMDIGRARGEKDFYDGSLGRVGAELSSEQKQIQDSRMDIATNGFGADAFQAAREQRLQGMQRDQQAQTRSLKGGQAASGVFGALSGAQSQALMGQQQRNTQEAERQLFLDDVNQKQQSLGLAESTVRGNREDVLGREKFNIAQRKNELMGLLTAQYGEAALGVTERSSAAAAGAARDYAATVAAQGDGGKK